MFKNVHICASYHQPGYGEKIFQNSLTQLQTKAPVVTREFLPQDSKKRMQKLEGMCARGIGVVKQARRLMMFA